MGGKRGTYTPEPVVPQALMHRYQTLMLVLAGQVNKSEGARRLGLSRRHFQDLCHRLMALIIAFLLPKRGGRPRMSETERRLRAENRRLAKHNAKLSSMVEKQQVQIEVMGQAIRSRPRSHGPRGGRSDSEDNDVAQRRAEAARQMLLRGVGMAIAALVIGVAACTLRRYLARARARSTLVRRRGPSPSAYPGAGLVRKVTALLEETRGRMGAVCLGRKTGGSRRQCAMIKSSVLRARERERKDTALQVRVSEPGLMRSFDQLYVRMDGLRRVLLICADACVPYRTSISLVDRYDARNVASVIDSDIKRHGAPLFWRMDRAKSHLSRTVMDLLRRTKVIPLIGPPRHPGFYGQMERMNREHRDWLSRGPSLSSGNIDRETAEMRRVLNEVMIRPTLNYRTAADEWGDRVTPHVDRTQLREEVLDLAAGSYAELHDQKDALWLSWRRAIESKMTQMGMLTIRRGQWC